MVLDFPSAFLLTNLLEMPVAWAFLRKAEAAGHVFLVVLLCNILTMPLLWFAFPALLRLPYIQLLAVSEAFVFGAEIALYIAAFRKAGWPRAMGAAFAANLMTLLASLVL